MSGFLQRIIDWISVEPAVSLLMIITAVVLFGSAFQQAKIKSNSFWPWLRRVIEASIGALLFVGLLWAFRAILNDNVMTFYSTHGSMSDAALASAQSIWGRPHVQLELSIAHYREVEIQEEIPREDLSQPPLYRTIVERQQVQQNSIVAFNGQADMQLSEREKGYAFYSGYVLDVQLNYDIVNDSSYETEAEFTFPLSPEQTLFENFVILFDGEDISSDLRFSQDLVSWTQTMRPHQEDHITISYSSRGMDYFYYQIPVQREIKDFVFTLTIDRLPISLLNYPDRIITPTEILPTGDGNGSVLIWRLDRAITVAGMGVSLQPPQQPGAQVLRVLVISPYALTLLGAMLALTLLIWGEKVHFLDLALLSAVYCMQFLIMAGTSDFFFGFWGSLIIGAALTFFLAVLLFRKLPSRLLRVVVYLLVGFFTLIYPLSGLLTEFNQQNAFDNLLLVGLILYVVGLSLYLRNRKTKQR
jgi:hypothetical protein